MAPDIHPLRSRVLRILLVLAGLSAFPVALKAQGTEYTRERLLEVARDIIESARYATLATADEEGRPRLRIMDPLPPEPGMVVWLATNPATRKVREIRENPEVALLYFDPDAPGYVSIAGTARLVDDARQKARHWKEAWTAFYPDRGDAVLLIEVTPRWMEVVSVTHGVTGPDEDWRPPRVEFGGN